MSKRKLSMDEKRVRMKELFAETVKKEPHSLHSISFIHSFHNLVSPSYSSQKDVFTLKELQRIAPKEKGIISQSVEDVLKSLVDDGDVQTDKIGLSNYFWAFPSQGIALKRAKLAASEREQAEAEERAAEQRKAHERLAAGREDSERRSTLLEALRGLRERRERAAAEIAQYAENDPDLLEALRRDAKRAEEGANRWTDNIFILKKYCADKFGLPGEDFLKSFGLPAEFDYVE